MPHQSKVERENNTEKIQQFARVLSPSLRLGNGDYWPPWPADAVVAASNPVSLQNLCGEKTPVRSQAALFPTTEAVITACSTVCTPTDDAGFAHPPNAIGNLTKTVSRSTSRTRR